ncbi:response regulator [Spirulina subsalsa]|uniref:response regulator n=1 Tax=Spirulina subsalsa TaxID=54311 RepID=UPI00036D12A9|nr:response regulator transcription factor [Spirulina subsalsa]
MSDTVSQGKLRILIVEDEPMMQLGLEQTLSTVSDFEIVGQAEDGYLAIEAAETLKPDVVVMDIGLPRLDGISATKQIKEKFPTMGVVMLKSHRLQREVVAALSSGADGYCIKGANIERLVTAIQAAKEGGSYLDPQVARLVMNNLHSPTSMEKREALHTLSEREMEVLKWIVEGKSNNEIAEILYLSPNTIKTHVRGLMNKLSVDDRVQAAVIALRSGLV